MRAIALTILEAAAFAASLIGILAFVVVLAAALHA